VLIYSLLAFEAHVRAPWRMVLLKTSGFGRVCQEAMRSPREDKLLGSEVPCDSRRV
jgi:hypothetical protein